MVGAATPKAFIEDMASSAVLIKKGGGLGGMHSLAGSKKLHSSLVMQSFRRVVRDFL